MWRSADEEEFRYRTQPAIRQHNNLFTREIRKFPLLSAEEEQAPRYHWGGHQCFRRSTAHHHGSIEKPTLLADYQRAIFDAPLDRPA